MSGVIEEPTSFLYPFIDAGETGPDLLLDDLTRSAREKAAASWELRLASLERSVGEITAAARAMAARFSAGGRLLCFGNGGSSTDAAAAAARFAGPARGTPLPARDLASDPAVLTAIANDVGVEAVFARQVNAHARPCDIALGFSTSGDSENVIAGFAEATRAGLLTVGLAGYSGGRMAGSGLVEHCLIVASDSVHRIQEAQSGLLDALWFSVQRALGEEAGG